MQLRALLSSLLLSTPLNGLKLAYFGLSQNFRFADYFDQAVQN